MYVFSCCLSCNLSQLHSLIAFLSASDSVVLLSPLLYTQKVLSSSISGTILQTSFLLLFSYIHPNAAVMKSESKVKNTVPIKENNCIYFIVSGEISVYLVKIKKASITSEMIFVIGKFDSSE